MTSEPHTTDAGTPEQVTERPNGDLAVTDSLGRSALLHWSRFHGLIVSTDQPGAVYLGQPETTAWMRSGYQQREHSKLIVAEGEIELCSGCLNSLGHNVAWDQAEEFGHDVREKPEPSPRRGDAGDYEKLRRIADAVAPAIDSIRNPFATATPAQEADVFDAAVAPDLGGPDYDDA